MESEKEVNFALMREFLPGICPTKLRIQPHETTSLTLMLRNGGEVFLVIGGRTRKSYAVFPSGPYMEKLNVRGVSCPY